MASGWPNVAVSDGDDEVGALGELAAAAVRDAVDGSEDRLAQLTHRVEGAVEGLALSQPVLLGHGLALSQVAANGEGTLTGPRQDHDPDGGPHRDRLDDLSQECAHLGGDRVVGMGSVEGDHSHLSPVEVVEEHGVLGLDDVRSGWPEVEGLPSFRAG